MKKVRPESSTFKSKLTLLLIFHFNLFCFPKISSPVLHPFTHIMFPSQRPAFTVCHLTFPSLRKAEEFFPGLIHQGNVAHESCHSLFSHDEIQGLCTAAQTSPGNPLALRMNIPASAAAMPGTPSSPQRPFKSQNSPRTARKASTRNSQDR